MYEIDLTYPKYFRQMKKLETKEKIQKQNLENKFKKTKQLDKKVIKMVILNLAIYMVIFSLFVFYIYTKS